MGVGREGGVHATLSRVGCINLGVDALEGTLPRKRRRVGVALASGSKLRLLLDACGDKKATGN